MPALKEIGVKEKKLVSTNHEDENDLEVLNQLATLRLRCT